MVNLPFERMNKWSREPLELTGHWSGSIPRFQLLRHAGCTSGEHQTLNP
jgi:hypothetical protein